MKYIFFIISIFSIVNQATSQIRPGKIKTIPPKISQTTIPGGIPQNTPKDDGCCVPIDKNMLQSIFTHVPTGGLNDPYKLAFNNNTQFKNAFQAYTDYLKILFPSLSKSVFHFKLMELQTGPDGNPSNTWAAPYQGAETWKWVIPGGNGTLFPNTNGLFSAQLQVGKWYKVHMGFYTEPEKCTAALDFLYRVQYKNGSLIRETSNGKRVVKMTNLKMNRRNN